MKHDSEDKTEWFILLFIFIVVPLSFTYSLFWGITVLIIGLTILGWDKRHDGPFPTYKTQIYGGIDMQSDDTGLIRIHPPGTRTTDYELVEKLSVAAPNSLRKAQDVLVAAKKYINKSGFFSSDSSRLVKIQSECHELVKALKSDGIIEENYKLTIEQSKKEDVRSLVEFLSLFSDAFPNWQNEYAVLNRYIPMFF